MEKLDWINHKERFKVNQKLQPKIDEVVSKIVGKVVLAQDPRLLKLVVKWKKGKPQDSMEPDNFLDDPKKVAELKEVFNKSI